MELRSCVVAVTALSAVMFVPGESARAQPSFSRDNLEVRHRPTADLTDYVVNRITLDFTGPLTEVQAWLEIDFSGGLHQEPLGGDGPPIRALLPSIPELEWDSFVALGGWHAETSLEPVVLGAAASISFAPPEPEFGSNLNLAWAPPPGIALADQDNFPIAQLTLSRFTNGYLHLFASADGMGFYGYPTDSPNSVISILVLNGCVGICFPEPSAIVLLGLGLVGALAFHGKKKLIQLRSPIGNGSA